MPIDFKPCPFCAGEPKEIEFMDYDAVYPMRVGVKCEHCDVGFEGPRFDRYGIIYRWNARP